MFYAHTVELFHVHIHVDSEGEAPKKKVKATPPKITAGSSKKRKSPAVKKEIKSVSDFFGSASVKRSSYFKSPPSSSDKEDKMKKQVSCGCSGCSAVYVQCVIL